MSPKNRRRALQYWIATGLSVLIPITALLAEQSDVNVPMNAALIALLLLGVTALDLVHLHPWQEIGELACTGWLIASPFGWNYSSEALTYCHLAIGVLLVLLAGYNLWKDRDMRATTSWSPR